MAKFQTRARTLDMLGRQQIAGLPTAISELFKNAYDAYADRVEVDFFRKEGLFVLSDDGVGMTRLDFEERWLTIGTESKVGAGTGLSAPFADSGKANRPVMGEKGIGRLAIGVIGPQVLVLSRARRPDGLHDLVAAFIHWGLFETPGINLEQIDIPVRMFAGGTVPDALAVNEMVECVRANVEELAFSIGPSRCKSICDDLDKFDVDPVDIAGYLDAPCLLGEGTGTQFFILPADESLIVDLDSEDDEEASTLKKMLIGFTNTMTPNHAKPTIETRFRDHKTDLDHDDLIESSEFWTPEDYERADHHIKGRFDDYGQFTGEIIVYGGEKTPLSVPWSSSRGRVTECGPFNIDFAYIQGRASETRLSLPDHAAMTVKLNKIGGLYIYRDGIRVLPYGNSEFDFLDIERRRSKSASRYYFSYRRMFGGIEITHSKNGDLHEKAGREGFRDNRAYRQFREILKNFFAQMAADFFREGGVHSEVWEKKRAEFTALDKARKRQEGQMLVKRRQFEKNLDEFFLHSAEAAKEVENILEDVGAELIYIQSLKDTEQAAVRLIDVESKARRKLFDLKRSLKVAKPNGVGISKKLKKDWEAYQQEMEGLDASVLRDAGERLQTMISDLVQQAHLEVSRRRRIEVALQELTTETQKDLSTKSKAARDSVGTVHNRVFDLAKSSMAEVDQAVKLVLSRFASTDFAGMQEAEVVALRIGLEQEITVVADRNREVLDKISDQLGTVAWDRDEQGHYIFASDLDSLLQEEVLDLRERADADVELSQLGMAVGIINHEFESTVKGLRSNLRQLKAWADVNEGLAGLYGSIRAGFDHLDGYLTLFTPLQRRLYRTPIEFTGGEIGTFLADLFKERFLRSGIVFETTPMFRKFTVTGYPSSFYPVFVNLIDNAVYWLNEKHGEGEKKIMLSVDGDSMLASDNGIGVAIRDRESIFELGFTRKLGGRGMGLHISKDVLRKVNYQLSLDESSLLGGATFRISPTLLVDEVLL